MFRSATLRWLHKKWIVIRITGLVRNGILHTWKDRDISSQTFRIGRCPFVPPHRRGSSSLEEHPEVGSSAADSPKEGGENEAAIEISPLPPVHKIHCLRIANRAVWECRPRIEETSRASIS